MMAHHEVYLASSLRPRAIYVDPNPNCAHNIQGALFRKNSPSPPPPSPLDVPPEARRVPPYKHVPSIVDEWGKFNRIVLK